MSRSGLDGKRVVASYMGWAELLLSLVVFFYAQHDLKLALVAGPLPARAAETIRCESYNMGYRFCRVNTDNRVELVRQISGTECRENRNWGYQSNGVWVNRGCGADFRPLVRAADHRQEGRAASRASGRAELASRRCCAARAGRELRARGGRVQRQQQ